jgi:hypothetical protein
LSKYGYHNTLLLGGLYIKHNKKDFWCFGNISNHIDSVFSDSNFTLLSNWETILSTYGLDQLVHNTTRVTGSKSVTLIDHIYAASRPEEVMQVRVSTYCPGDHYPVSCSVKYGKSNKNKNKNKNKNTLLTN